MKFLIAAVLMAGITGAQAAQFQCEGADGEIALSTMSKSELKEIGHGVVRGINLLAASEDMVPYISALEESDKEDDVAITATKKEITEKVTHFDLWDGNWGWQIAVPNKAFETKLKKGDTFSIQYQYDYNDIAEQTVKNKMKCTVESI